MIKKINQYELKRLVEASGDERYFFTRDTMKFFGDTMKNYGVRISEINGKEVYELYRKNPVKHGLKESAYFEPETFKQVFV